MPSEKASEKAMELAQAVLNKRSLGIADFASHLDPHIFPGWCGECEHYYKERRRCRSVKGIQGEIRPDGDYCSRWMEKSLPDPPEPEIVAYTIRIGEWEGRITRFAEDEWGYVGRNSNYQMFLHPFEAACHLLGHRLAELAVAPYDHSSGSSMCDVYNILGQIHDSKNMNSWTAHYAEEEAK